MSMPQPSYEYHPLLNFPDGDVILSTNLPPHSKRGDDPIDGTPATHRGPLYRLFRVHRVILALHSAVFSNMFSDAKPGFTLEDMPTAELFEDPDALALMIRFMYNPFSS